jgi:ubiquinone/menaquinone biosynthesis C-methylase UbiE
VQLHRLRLEEFRLDRLACSLKIPTMRRTLTAELLDDDRGTPAEIQKSLDDLWRINRWLGGLRSNLRMLERVAERSGLRTLKILDVGAGDARLAGSLKAALQRRKIQAEFVVLDRRHSHLRNGGSRMTAAVVSDVFQSPFRDGSFDVAMCNLFFHHFPDDRAIELLQRLARLATSAVIVNDLERNALPYLFIRLAYPFARSRITRHDGPASVRQAFSPAELSSIVRRAGFENFLLERFTPFRLGLTIWTAASEAAGD